MNPTNFSLSLYSVLLYSVLGQITTHYLFVDPWASRNAPPAYSERNADSGVPEYVITPDRLNTIRQSKLYPFFDKGGNDNNAGHQGHHAADQQAGQLPPTFHGVWVQLHLAQPPRSSFILQHPNTVPGVPAHIPHTRLASGRRPILYWSVLLQV